MQSAALTLSPQQQEQEYKSYDGSRVAVVVPNALIRFLCVFYGASEQDWSCEASPRLDETCAEA